MSKQPIAWSRDLEDLEIQLDAVVAILMATSVFDPEWDYWVALYKIISFDICKLTGDIATCDSISY